MKSPETIHFSICIPVYNGRRFLAETLASIRAQTYPHWELIVAEDGSPEPSRDIVEGFAATVAQSVTYLASPANLGCPAARDLAMARARHPVIASIDADDLWRPDHLEAMADTFARTGADFVFSGFTMFFVDRESPPQSFAPPENAMTDLRAGYYFQRYWLQPSMVAFTRKSFDAIGGWAKNVSLMPAWMPHRNRCEDRNFFMRVIQHGTSMAWTGKITVDYRKYATSTTGYHDHGSIDRAWFYDYYGPMKGIGRRPQRKFIALLDRQAGDDLSISDPRHAAWFYYRAWRNWPWRGDRLLRAVLAYGRSFCP